MNATARQAASPYARRLARERGLTLELITGSGPGGRIVAADVEAFVDRRAAHPTAAATAGAQSLTSVFGVSIDLGAANRLLADLAAAGNELALEDMLVRAGAQALEAVPAARLSDSQIVVALEAGEKPDVIIKDAHLGLITALHRKLAAGRDGEAQSDDGPAQLSIRRFEVAGIRAVAMPLRGSAPLRFVLSAAADGAAAEALLSFDAGRIDEAVAAELLGRLRDSLQTPLRLLA